MTVKAELTRSGKCDLTGFRRPVVATRAEEASVKTDDINVAKKHLATSRFQQPATRGYLDGQGV